MPDVVDGPRRDATGNEPGVYPIAKGIVESPCDHHEFTWIPAHTISTIPDHKRDETYSMTSMSAKQHILMGVSTF